MSLIVQSPVSTCQNPETYRNKNHSIAFDIRVSESDIHFVLNVVK